MEDIERVEESKDGPVSLDSEYDEYLALSDIEIGNAETLNGEREPTRSHPYDLVHQSPTKFKSPHRNLFIPGQEINLKITNYERTVTTHLLNPNLYTIEIIHGDFYWTIKRRYKHIQHLHQQLRLFRATLNLPFPTKTHRERRTSFKNDLSRNKGEKKKRALPRFPSKPEALVQYEEIEHRVKQLEEYLQNLLKIDLYKNHLETAVFLEVSELSFVSALGNKGKEGMVMKRTRSTHPASSTGCNICGCLDSSLCVRCNFLCSDMCGSWRTRWLIVKDSFVAYIKPKTGRIKSVLLFDSGFDVSSSYFTTGMRKGVHISNLSREIVLKCHTRREAKEWQEFIKDTVFREGYDYTLRNRYGSFTPVRSLMLAGWLVDGSSYTKAVANAIEMAKHEIFIADWWLSPEIHMKRPAVEGDYWRLDCLLKRKAEAGVKIFVLLYKEVEMALGINSYYSKQKLLEGTNGNIKILRHPDHAKAGVFLWAHHEKLVVVDQNIAFTGGIDLCYGRWDNYQHRLTDLGSVSQNETIKEMGALLGLSLVTTATAASYLAKYTKLENGDANGSVCEDTMLPSPESIKCNTPEMERRSLFDTMKMKSKGLITLWNHSTDENEEQEPDPDPDLDPQNLTKEVSSPALQAENTCNEEDDEEAPSDLIGSAKLWIGKDYTNFILKDFSNLQMPFQDLVNRNNTARMPWHDVGVVVQGKVARDLARHFIQRWNAIKLEKAKLNPQYPYLLPKSNKIPPQEVDIPGVKQIRVACQAVRSISHWSGGFLDPEYWEGSIHEAYVDVISKANHYIYIENQFFISLVSQQVRNQVADALYKRILRAYKEGTTFRVYIVLPLLPGFEGEVGSPSGTALHAITHWNYASLCRGKESLISRLREAGVLLPHDYITIHGLRTHSMLGGTPITELIYVHSKLLIADDRVVICGSANINDRSLLGKRDSEVAVVIEDEEFEKGIMNGQPYHCGKFAGSLRKRLFKEHLGLLEDKELDFNILDPVSDKFYHDVWKATALRNTEIYEEVFRCIPSDEVLNFHGLKKYNLQESLSIKDPDAAKMMLREVAGHLVMFPLKFLKDESLTPNPGSVTGMLPTSVWT